MTAVESQQCATLRDLLVKAATMNADLRQQNAKLKQALKRYGEHSPDCAYADNLRGDCNCGLAEALAVKP